MNTGTVRFVLANKDLTKFYKSGEFFVTSVFNATPYLSKENAQYAADVSLSSFQRDLFTEIVLVEFKAEYYKVSEVTKS
jgi:hypothetical protein